MASESKTTNYYDGCIEKCNGKVFKVVGSASQKKGFPDRIYFHRYLPGGCVFVEWKKDKGKVGPAQELWLEEMRKRGVNALIAWIRTKDDKIDLIDPANGEVRESFGIAKWARQAEGKIGAALIQCMRRAVTKRI